MKLRVDQRAAKGALYAVEACVSFRGPVYKLGDENSRVVCGLAAGKTLASKICTPVCPERLKAVAGSPLRRIKKTNLGAAHPQSKCEPLPKSAAPRRCNAAREQL